MQFSKIKVDHWYQTKQGVGLCLDAQKRSPPAVKFNIVTRGVVYLSPKDVQYELPEDQRPHAQGAEPQPEDSEGNDPAYVTGVLHRNAHDRWEIFAKDDKTVALFIGGEVELQIAGQWIKTTIEHNGKDYYATTRGIALSAGMSARVRR